MGGGLLQRPGFGDLAGDAARARPRPRECCRTAAANAYRNRDVVPVKVIVETGPQFKLRDALVVERGTGRPFDPAVAPPDVLKLKPGDPARTADLRAANARLVDYFRAQSRPLVKAPLPSPVVDHAARQWTCAFPVDPGPKGRHRRNLADGAEDVRSRSRALVHLSGAGRALHAKGAGECAQVDRHDPGRRLGTHSGRRPSRCRTAIFRFSST